jgi:hypothetical protein
VKPGELHQTISSDSEDQAIWALCDRSSIALRPDATAAKSTRIGVYKCKDCRKPFTVKVGTIFEDSHIPMRIWLQAIALMCASKKGISANQLHRMTGLTLKSAWFMAHRIREAMRSGALAPMGGVGGIVEIDETTQGRTATAPPLKEMSPRVYGGWDNRNVVLALVERGGEVRTFHVSGTSIGELMPVIRANVSKEAQVMIWYKYMRWRVRQPRPR